MNISSCYFQQSLSKAFLQMSLSFNPNDVNLDTADPAAVTCYLNAGKNEYDGRLGTRISALFVILAVSSAATFFPVLAVRIRWIKIPLYVYLFARYFGAGVIIATAICFQSSGSSLRGDRTPDLCWNDWWLGKLFLATRHHPCCYHAHLPHGLRRREIRGDQVRILT